jgi:carbonic anhydrase
VNLNAGAKTKLSAIIHGCLMLTCVALFPTWLNSIPLACLAAILLVTGIQLISPSVVNQMWTAGRTQFIPFSVTIAAILLTDLFFGSLIGLVVSISFILHSNLRRPLRCVVEKHFGGEVTHIELANQVSFLNRAVLDQALNDLPRGSQVLLDARSTNYIDPDVLTLLRDFRDVTAPARNIQVSLLGFRDTYQIDDTIRYVDYSSRDVQSRLTPAEVLQILKDGNERFRTGNRLTRDLGRQVSATAVGQYPIAVVLSCIDSRNPVELVFDLGLGDIFSIRIAGNISSSKILGSMEYGCVVAGAKVALVMGHTRCGAVNAAVKFASSTESASVVTGCQHLDQVVTDIQLSVDRDTCGGFPDLPPDQQIAYADEVARRNVLTTIRTILHESQTLKELVESGRLAIVGGMYDVTTGRFEFIEWA